MPPKNTYQLYQFAPYCGNLWKSGKPAYLPRSAEYYETLLEVV